METIEIYRDKLREIKRLAKIAEKDLNDLVYLYVHDQRFPESLKPFFKCIYEA